MAEVEARASWAPGVVVLAGAALALINSTVANVMIPAMQRDLDLSSAGVSWALAGWALTYALALIPAGQWGDRFGHRRMFIIGLALFAATSGAAVFVTDETQLVIVRLVQGVAGGLFYPAIAAVLSTTYQGRVRARAFGALGATIGAGAAVGPLLGGVLLQAFGDDLGWRTVFLINVPLSLGILVAAWFALPPTRGAQGVRGFDGVGFALLTVGLGAALVPLIVGESFGWPAWTWACLVAGLAIVGAFASWQRRAERRGRPVIVAPSLFRSRDFTVAVALGLTQFAGFISIFYVLALLWQTGLGRSPLEMGLLTLPEAVGSILGSMLVARMTQRFGSRAAVIVGTGALTAGMALTTVALVVIPIEQLSAAWLIAPLLLTGIGGGLSISATLNHALSGVAREHVGSASGIVATVQRVGNAVGLAAVGGVLFSVLAGALDPATPNDPAALAAGYLTAAIAALATCTAMTGAGFALSFALRRSPAPVR